MTDTGLRWGANLRFVVAMVAFAMTLYHLWTAAFGPPVREVHAPLHLCFALTVLFLTPLDPGGLSSIRRIMLRSYDMLIMAIAIAGTAYLMLNADHIATRMLYV